eukprot:PhF_6_TR30540/c0_g1_i4/m.44820/K07374/TUBA; tubulin alpha
MGGDTVFLHLGSAGIGIGREYWDSLVEEHKSEDVDKPSLALPKTHSYETADGKRHARCLFLDTDCETIYNLRRTWRKGCDYVSIPNCPRGWRDGSACHFSRGMYTVGKYLFEDSEELIRHKVETCDRLSTLHITNGISGGTGGGFGAFLTERLRREYGRCDLVTTTVVPRNCNPIDAYTTVLSLYDFINNCSLCTFVQNECVRSLLDASLEGMKKNTTTASSSSYSSFASTNQIIAMVMSSMDCTTRFPSMSSRMLDYSDISTLLCPFPRLHFVLPSVSGVVYNQATSKQGKATIPISLPRGLLATKTQLTDINLMEEAPLRGRTKIRPRLFSSVATFRGAEVKNCGFTAERNYREYASKLPSATVGQTYVPKEDDEEVEEKDVIGPEVRYSGAAVTCAVPWGKTRSSSEPTPPVHPNHAVQVVNTSAINPIFQKWELNFDFPYSKRSQVHWLYGEGMESGEFGEKREELARIIKDYEEVAKVPIADSCE